MKAIGRDGDVADAAGAGEVCDGVAYDMIAVGAELEADQPVRFERRHQQRILPAGNGIRGICEETAWRLGRPVAFVAGGEVVIE